MVVILLLRLNMQNLESDSRGKTFTVPLAKRKTGDFESREFL